jgi:hypothetical protein
MLRVGWWPRRQEPNFSLRLRLDDSLSVLCVLPAVDFNLPLLVAELKVLFGITCEVWRNEKETGQVVVFCVHVCARACVAGGGGRLSSMWR